MNRVEWLKKSNVTYRWSCAVLALWVLGLFVTTEFSLLEEIESNVSLPSFFRVRAALEKSPKIDPRIKVFAMDDNTVSWLNRPKLYMDEWAQIFHTLDRKKVKGVFVDGMFSMARTSPGKKTSGWKKINDLNKLKTPIFAGSFPAAQKIPHRKPLDLSKNSYRVSRYMMTKDLAQSKSVQLRYLDKLGFKSSKTNLVYGPDPKIRDHFSGIGHILYTGKGTFYPFMRLSHAKILPHIMIFADESPRFHQGNLYLNKTKVPINDDGSTYINFSEYREYLRHLMPLRLLLDKKTINATLANISSEDIVYIMPAFYSGNTDFKLTPFGNRPAGFAHLSVLNSILIKEWLTGKDIHLIGIILVAVAGAITGTLSSALVFGLILIAVPIFWLLACMYLFASANMVLPLFIPVVSFCGPLLTFFIEKNRVAEKKSEYLKASLDGSVSPENLNSLAKVPQKLNLEARERVVTVMFIDVVGFSLLAENQLPRIAFDSLKKVLSEIAERVHSHGGIVNRNLGDGLLCFFGYSLDRDESTFDHAERAVACAIEIQKFNVPKTIEDYRKGEPVYPLRIGINTSSVFLGDIGTGNRLDFTIVGNGVNYAKRLEGACTKNCVMLGSTTRELIEPLGLTRNGLLKRLIEIKHYEDLIEAWEYDPFHDNPRLRLEAEEVHKESSQQARVEKRWQVDRSDNVIAVTSVGVGELINFSNTGLSIKLPNILVKGAIFKLGLDSLDGTLREKLQKENLSELLVEVRWSYLDGKDAMHGVQFRDIDAEKTNFITQLLCEYCLHIHHGERSDKNPA
ncbi:MAG: CHASE2 domain-containing protein [Pseudobacteriovorax sp.]|nr:CHASE2 domain-containing protein [Pseudobacteriovorax sp.]